MRLLLKISNNARITEAYQHQRKLKRQKTKKHSSNVDNKKIDLYVTPAIWQKRVEACFKLSLCIYGASRPSYLATSAFVLLYPQAFPDRAIYKYICHCLLGRNQGYYGRLSRCVIPKMLPLPPTPPTLALGESVSRTRGRDKLLPLASSTPPGLSLSLLRKLLFSFIIFIKSLLREGQSIAGYLLPVRPKDKEARSVFTRTLGFYGSF